MARRSPATGAVVLSHLEFDLVWEDLGFGDPPAALDVPSHGATEADRDRLGAEVLATLARAGLVDEHDDVVPELEELFGILRHHTVSVDALVFGEQPWRVLAAVRGSRGVLAVLNNEELALEPIAREDLVRAVAKVLGERPAGPGEQVRLPRPAYSAALRGYAEHGYDALERALAGAGVRGSAMRPLITIAQAGRLGAGQLAVTGGRGRSPVLTWSDTEAGRYVITTEDVRDEQWVRVVPADLAWLTRRLTEMVADAG
ncbi:EspG family protein [Lentzea xinjiangensis]|uniref:EspG family protein n=1 Tax=Lentzea xinjiangensis TaxID=402600 RepID=A0A1H9W2H1_9PSEU|nr:ESX secretion-associated protein EspG [Lentzea xinjiangensis]SES27979.1 EspG family protein [Lentzea xinjiangensis]